MKIFLIVYMILLLVITILFIAYGKVRDPRFYITVLAMVIVGKFVASHFDKSKR